MNQQTEGKTFSWQALVAIGGLIATLIGVWVEYSNKQEELEQAKLKAEQEKHEAQQKIDIMLREAEEKRQLRHKQRTEIQRQLDAIIEKIAEAEFDIRRGTTGVIHAPDDQKSIAVEIAVEATARKIKLIEEKSKIEAKLASLGDE